MTETKSPEITLGMPTYNEAENIRATLERSIPQLESTGRTWEILVVDNHSGDDTAAIVREVVDAEPRVRLIVHPENRTWAGSLRTCLAEARGKYVGWMDSDGQFSAEDLPRMLARLEAGANVVYGWRRNRKDPLNRKVISFVFNSLARILLDCKLKDLNTGFQVFDRKFMSVARIEQKMGYANPELYVRARAADLAIEEVEVHHYPREHGETHHDFLRAFRIFRDAFRYFWNLRREHISGRRRPAEAEPDSRLKSNG